MKKSLLLSLIIVLAKPCFAHLPDSLLRNIGVIKKHVFSDYKGMLKKSVGILHYPLITHGSSSYANDQYDRSLYGQYSNWGILRDYW